ncbi:MAG: glycosyltransferase 87 family protein [Limisphaerales bacterium]
MKNQEQEPLAEGGSPRSTVLDRSPEPHRPPEPGWKADNWLWLYAAIAGSVLLRLTVLNFESGDYRAFLSNWYHFLVEHGRWHGLGQEFSSYPPLYLSLLSLSTLLPLPALYAVKFITIACEYGAAWFVWKLVRWRFPGGNAAWLAVTVFLFLPTVVMNGAVWGQCDAMYTGCFLASLFYFLERRPVAALVAFGLACSLKPQAIFWCPLLAGLLISGRWSWRRIWVPVAVYLGCGVPQMLAGRSILRTAGHWATVGNYPGVVFGAPNWYQWLSGENPDVFWWPGVVLALCATAWLALWMREGCRTPGRATAAGPVAARLDGQRLVSLAMLSVLFPPFLLPGMHERYFFAADVLSVVYAFYVPGGWRAALLVQFASAFAYLPYLFGATPVPLPVLALAPLAALALVTRDLVLGARANGPGQERPGPTGGDEKRGIS